MRLYYDTGELEFDPFLPISVDKKLGTCKYSTFIKLFGATPLTYPELLSEDAFTVCINGGNMICYNESPDVSPTRRRFSIAHELGHYALRHHTSAEWEEKEADCFARNLLAPRLIALLHDIRFEDYQMVFGISAAAARMCETMSEEDYRLALQIKKFLPVRQH